MTFGSGGRRSIQLSYTRVMQRAMRVVRTGRGSDRRKHERDRVEPLRERVSRGDWTCTSDLQLPTDAQNILPSARYSEGDNIRRRAGHVECAVSPCFAPFASLRGPGGPGGAVRERHHGRGGSRNVFWPPRTPRGLGARSRGEVGGWSSEQIGATLPGRTPGQAGKRPLRGAVDGHDPARLLARRAQLGDVRAKATGTVRGEPAAAGARGPREGTRHPRVAASGRGAAGGRGDRPVGARRPRRRGTVGSAPGTRPRLPSRHRAPAGGAPRAGSSARARRPPVGARRGPSCGSRRTRGEGGGAPGRRLHVRPGAGRDGAAPARDRSQAGRLKQPARARPRPRHARPTPRLLPKAGTPAGERSSCR